MTRTPASALTPPLEGQTYRFVHDIDETDSAAIDGERVHEAVADIAKANVITSEVAATADFPRHMQAHRLAIDLDVPAVLVPSSTPGHSHLYIDAPMNWPQYVKVLEALATAGIIEPGYVSASKARGYTALRLPWIRKAPPKPTEAVLFDADLFA